MPRLRPVIAKEEKQVLADQTLFEKPEEQPVEEAFGAKEEAEPEVKAEPEPKPEPKVEVKPEPAKVEPPKVDEAALALQRQVDELRRSEQALKQSNREYQEQIAQRQKQIDEGEETTINVALQGARDRVAVARSERRKAKEDGDVAAEDEAEERYLLALGDLREYQRAKDDIETRKQAPKPEPQPTPQTQQLQFAPGSDAEINSWQIPERAKTWAREHRDWVTDPAKREKMARVSLYLTRDLGIPMDSDAFYMRLEADIGIKQPEPQPTANGQQQQPERKVPVSAPVSREVPSAGSGSRQQPGKVTLTAEEKEAAKISGVTEIEYARQKVKLAEMRERGEYGERR